MILLDKASDILFQYEADFIRNRTLWQYFSSEFLARVGYGHYDARGWTKRRLCVRHEP